MQDEPGTIRNMHTKTILRAFAGFAAIGGAACSASAQHVDMLLLVDGNGDLVTGEYDFDTFMIANTDTRVFEAEFDIFGASDEPGFNALSAPQVPMGFSALPANSDVVFIGKAIEIDSITSNLWHWDATGSVSFSPIAAGTILSVSKAPSVIFESILDGSASDVAGFSINPTDSQGFLHKHVDFTVIDVNTAPTGFYLWSFQLEVGGLTSEPVFFVHGLGEHPEELHEQAVDWVQANLVDEAPACCLGNASKDSPGDVNFSDVTSVLASWLTDYGAGNTGPGDADCDGLVNFTDITVVLGNWLNACP